MKHTHIYIFYSHACCIGIHMQHSSLTQNTAAEDVPRGEGNLGHGRAPDDGRKLQQFGPVRPGRVS